MTSDDGQLNPYQSPQVLDTNRQSDVAELELGDYRPQLMPRDFVDVAYGVVFALTGGILYYAFPIGLGLLLKIPAIMLPIIFITLFGTAVVVMLSGITGMTIQRDECIAKRRFRRDIVLPWREVTFVRELSRGEAIAALSFSPHLGCSQTMTSRGHFRIESGSRFVVFAPRDIPTFRSTIRGLTNECRSRPSK